MLKNKPKIILFVLLLMVILVLVVSCFFLNKNVTVRGQLSISQGMDITRCCFVDADTLGCDDYTETLFTTKDIISTQAPYILEEFKSRVSQLKLSTTYCTLISLKYKLKFGGKYISIFKSGELPSLVMIKNIKKSNNKYSLINIEYTGDKNTATIILNTYMQTVLYMNTEYRFEKGKEALVFLSKQIDDAKKRLEESESVLLLENTAKNHREVTTNQELYNSLLRRRKEVNIATAGTSKNEILITQKAKIISGSSIGAF